MKRKAKRSTLAPAEARRHFIRMAELAVLQQIKDDARLLDQGKIAIGPFARLDAGEVAARAGKTRGAITNLFKSQSAFQAETMALALNASMSIDRLNIAMPKDYATAEDWLDAVLAAESAIGPVHGSKPAANYGFLWALWLSTVPYGLWSKRVSEPSMAEQLRWTKGREAVLQAALDHFKLSLRPGVSLSDLSLSIDTIIEGSWLNQCLTRHHPCEPEHPISEQLRRAGRLLWRGATLPGPDRA